jgi:hypothetical protein
MQYLLIISHDNLFAPTETLIQDIGAWIKKMERRGVRVYGNPLRPPGEATTVRVRKGKMVLTKGPFAKSKEKMCAYELIECSGTEEAIEVASQHPMAKVGECGHIFCRLFWWSRHLLRWLRFPLVVRSLSKNKFV